MNWVKDDGSPEWTFEIVGYGERRRERRHACSRTSCISTTSTSTKRARPAKAPSTNTWSQSTIRATPSEISQAIDHLFANSSAETTTLNEREYVVAQLRQVGDVRMFVNSIIGAVLFTLLFLAGNTMSQSVRDRVPELGVLKTLGFSDTAVSVLVVVEASLLCLVGRGNGPRDRRGGVSDGVRLVEIRGADPAARQGLGHRLRHRAVVGRAERVDPRDPRAEI